MMIIMMERLGLKGGDEKDTDQMVRHWMVRRRCDTNPRPKKGKVTGGAIIVLRWEGKTVGTGTYMHIP